jgi:hypothetical protein
MQENLQHKATGRVEEEHVAEKALLMEAACYYLSCGFSVIPLNGKLPVIRWKEFQTRQASSVELESWFSSGANLPTGIGIVTGRLSGIVVVDCDRNEDGEFWRENFPASPVVIATGGGGSHFYYAYPIGSDIRNHVGVLDRKIDIRAEGGYITAPPSRHPCGKRYSFLSADWKEALPAFDKHWISSPRTEKRLPLSAETKRVKDAVAYIGKVQAVSGEGGHNATFRAACKLRDAGLSADEALAVLSDWNERNADPPWSESELAHKIDSAFRRSR